MQYDWALYLVQQNADAIRSLEGQMSGLSGRVNRVELEQRRLHKRLRALERQARRITEMAKLATAGLLAIGGLWEQLPEPLRQLLFKS